MRTRFRCCSPVSGAAGASAFMSGPPSRGAASTAHMSSSTREGALLAGMASGGPNEGGMCCLVARWAGRLLQSNAM